MFGFSKDEKLAKAVAARDWPEAGSLLEKGANPNSLVNGVPVHFFVWVHAPESVREQWVAKGADLKQTSEPERKSAISAASAGGSPDGVRFLLKHGASANERDSSGLSCLMSAAYLDDFETVDVLIAAGAQLEVRDMDRNTALMFASKTGATACVVRLLAAGAGPNALGEQRSTAVMFAAQGGHLATVQELVESGADIEIRGDHGLNALGFAEQNGHTGLASWLKTRSSA